jgi:hypothetical protein
VAADDARRTRRLPALADRGRRGGRTSVAELEATLQDGLARFFAAGAAQRIPLRFSGAVFYLRPA